MPDRSVRQRNFKGYLRQDLQQYGVFTIFAARYEDGGGNGILIKHHNMKTLLKYSGAILVLLGVVCLLVYYVGVRTNAMLVVAMVLEVVGILTFILTNKYIE